jgi:ABC transporter fused permease/ATP-binding protein
VKSIAPSYGITRLLRLAWPERKRLSWGLLALIVSSGMLLAYPQAIKVMIDEALTEKNADRLNAAALAILLVFLLQAVAGAIRYYLFTTAGERVVIRLRQDLYEAIMRQDIAFFDERRTGELMSRLSSDATVLQNAVSVNISMVTRNLGAAVGGIGLLIYTSPLLTFGLLLAIPPVAIGTARFGKSLRRISRDVQDALATTGTIAEETISGVRTVRAFAQESTEADRYREGLVRSLGLALERSKRVAWFTALASAVGYAAIIGVLWYGGQLVLKGSMSIGALSSFILYTLTVAVSVGMLGSLWTDFMSATGAARRVFELLDHKPSMSLSGGYIPPSVKGSIQLRDVHFAYPSRPDYVVFEKLSLDIAPGECLALVGPSGSGKSTLAALVSRFYDPLSGSILWDGIPVQTLDAGWLRRQIGIVAQDPVLLSTSIAANIRYGRPEADQAAIEAAARAANAHEFITALPDGYHTLVGERGIQLSGGQRQRVAIARAMLKDPRVLILDEATSALDAESEYLVQEALDRLMKGRTTLVIAHRLSTVRHANRVVVMEQGQIVQMGQHDELMLNQEGLYYRLVNRQFVEASPL